MSTVENKKQYLVSKIKLHFSEELTVVLNEEDMGDDSEEEDGEMPEDLVDLDHDSQQFKLKLRAL